MNHPVYYANLTIINVVWYFVLYSRVESVPRGLCISIRLKTPHPTKHIIYIYDI